MALAIAKLRMVPMNAIGRTGEKKRSLYRPLTHKEYCGRGKCPSRFLPEAKVKRRRRSYYETLWCFESAGHKGPHWALDIRPMIVAKKIYWTDDESVESVEARKRDGSDKEETK